MSTVDDGFVSESGDLRSLNVWLRAEDELRGHVALQAKPIREGEMGGVVEAISVAIGNGGLAVVLVRSLFTWLGTRKTSERPATRLMLRTGSGRRAEIEFTEALDPKLVIDKVLGFMHDDEGGVWIDIRTGSGPA